MPLTASALSQSKQLTGMPQPARYIYQQAYESKISQGKSERVARNYALKELSSTGWQQARFGWVANLQAPQMVQVRVFWEPCRAAFMTRPVTLPI